MHNDNEHSGNSKTIYMKMMNYEWWIEYLDGKAGGMKSADKYNDDRLAYNLNTLFKADHHNLMCEISAKIYRFF